MYTAFHIQNFRLFDTLDITNLARVNLITGRNNTGKTSLLEALFVHVGGYIPELILRLHGLRGHSLFKYELSPTGRGPWDSTFYEFDSTREIVIRSQYSQGTRTQTIKVLRTPEEIKASKASGVVISRQAQNGDEEVTALSSEATLILEVRYQADDQDVRYHAYVDKNGVRFDPTPTPRFPGYFLRGNRAPEDAEHFSNLVSEGGDQHLVEILQLVEPSLRDLTLLIFSGETLIHGVLSKGKPKPLSLMGDGVARLASMYLAIYAMKGGVVLFDEMENGLHYSTHKAIWKAIDQVSRQFNTQVFATTHSYEFMVAAHEAFKETYPESADYNKQFRIYRLDYKKDGGIEAVAYDQEIIDIAIESGLEMR